MDNGMEPGLVVDQGLCYPADPNYYGYYCTGFESPVEWDDHHKFFSSDGSDIHYSGLQTESIPYVYYTPSFDYAQSPYNPYNPYIPGAVVGADSPFVGTQRYYANPTYQHPVSSSAFVPVYAQPGSEIVPNTSLDPNLLHEDASIRTDTIVPKHTPTVSAIVGGPAQKSASGNAQQDSTLVASQQLRIAKLSGSKVNMTPNKQPSLGTTSGNTTHPTPSQDTQNRSASGLMQSADNFSHGKLSSLRNQLKVTVPDNGFIDVASNGWGWTTVDKFRPGLQYGMMNENRSSDMLSEQNRGPRTNRLKGQWASSIPVKAHSDRAGASNVQENIIIYADQFNKEDFSVNYPNAKFFVIKSYSEDDVHKSIKYNVWSSTSSGNKKLATAYEDARRISAGNPKGCPIFLFFSVNASGQFCGVAEMVGPVDFHKDMDFWQQDKWTGSFPVKWHIVKDVPNTNFRNIILENNENKPVTNSRDTQELTFVPGIMMLNIFKNSPLKTSLLDDFMYYEERQKTQQEEKSRFLGRTYDGSFFVPATVPSNNLNSMVIQPSKTNGTADQPSIPAKKHIEYKDTGKTNDTSNQPPNSEEKQVESDGTGNISTVDKQVNLNSMVIQPLKTNGKADQSSRAAKKHIEYKDTGKINDTFNQPPKSEEKHIESDGVGNTSTGDKQVHLNGMVIQPSKTNGTADQPPRAAKKHIEYKVPGKINDTFNQPPNSEEKHIESDGAGNTSIRDKQVNSEADGARPSKVDGMKSKLVKDDSNVNAVIKIGSLYIESKAPVTERDASEDVVTVGTIPVKINGFKGERFPVLTVGTIPLNPGAFKRDN